MAAIKATTMSGLSMGPITLRIFEHLQKVCDEQSSHEPLGPIRQIFIEERTKNLKMEYAGSAGRVKKFTVIEQLPNGRWLGLFPRVYRTKLLEVEVRQLYGVSAQSGKWKVRALVNSETEPAFTDEINNLFREIACSPYFAATSLIRS